MALNAQQKETKNLATALLEADGKDYDQALDEFHQDIISKNKDTIMKGLKALRKMNKNDGKEERGKASETEKTIQHQQ